jgi:hypothetical protein
MNSCNFRLIPIGVRKFIFSKFIICLFAILISSTNEKMNDILTEYKDSNRETINASYIIFYSNSKNNDSDDDSFKIEEDQTQNLTKCTLKICDSIGGECIDDQICKCNEGFTTYLRNNSMKLCNYQKKNSVIAAFLELFLGFGLGHLYSGRKIIGIFKLFLSCMLCCIGCCAIGIGMKLDSEIRSDQPNTVVVFLYFIFVCILYVLVFWQILDFILFIFKIYSDGNEIPLY